MAASTCQVSYEDKRNASGDLFRAVLDFPPKGTAQSGGKASTPWRKDEDEASPVRPAAAPTFMTGRVHARAHFFWRTLCIPA